MTAAPMPSIGRKTCLTCPSLLNGAEQARILGKSVGGNVCATKLIAIGRPGIETRQPEVVAGKCDSYGLPRPELRATATTAAVELTVGFPNGASANEGPAPTPVSSCGECEHYIQPRETLSSTGWKAGFCAAKGSLLLEDRLTRYAIGCSYKTPLVSRLPLTTKINLLPEYLEGFGKKSVLDAYYAALRTDNDPTKYVTDKPVPEKAQDIGIRAFRRVEDPTGYGPDVFLPVFDLESFSDELKERVPRTDDEERPEFYIDYDSFVYDIAVMWRRLGETPVVWGQPGVGKTELFRHLAWMMVLPFERISISSSTELDDIMGKMLYSKEKGTYFQYGQLSRAYRRAGVICLDEANTGQPAVWQRIRPLTDDSKQFILDLNEYELIKKHSACFLGMAMNPSWDPRNIGTEPLADADGSRLVHMEMTLPPREVEREILLRRLLIDNWREEDAKPIIDTALRIADDLRRLSDSGDLPVSISPRTLIKVTRLLRYSNWTKAFKLALANSVEPETKRIILDTVRNFCGDS